MTGRVACRERLRVGLGQMSSTVDVDANLETIAALAARAAESGCGLLALPENAPLLAPEQTRLLRAEQVSGHQIEKICSLAALHQIAILVGSFGEVGPDAQHTYNTSVLINDLGEVIATYRKIHLFDVDVAADTKFRESASVAPGAPEVVCAELFGWKLGLSICYDLRFPEMYRRLVDFGAELLCVPAAFTFRTGTAHWHTLLRARAIENLAWVIAPAQTGTHYGNRESYGHSLGISPWGDVRADAGRETSLVVFDVVREELDAARARFRHLYIDGFRWGERSRAMRGFVCAKLHVRGLLQSGEALSVFMRLFVLSLPAALG